VTTQYEAEINGRVRQVSVHREDGAFRVSVDGREWTVDARRIDAHTVSLLVSEKIRLRPERRTVSRPSSYEATVTPDAATGQLTVRVGAASVPVTLNGRRRWGRKEEGPHSAAGPERVVAPMPGKVVRVLVQQGQTVRARQPIVVIEAMKMENELRAGRDGTVAELPARDGQSVEAGALLAVITGAAGPR
jgi:biotin carboxyl carrier protein